jgi:hypothetical protein
MCLKCTEIIRCITIEKRRNMMEYIAFACKTSVG